MSEKQTIEFLASDTSLPSWFLQFMASSGNRDKITLYLSEDKVEIEDKPDGLEADYVKENEKAVGVEVWCTILSEDITIDSLLIMDGESIFSIPDGLSFLTQSIKGLDVCFGVVDFCEDNAVRGETYRISYTDSITLVKGILEFDKATLVVQKWETAYLVAVTGEFQIGDGFSLILAAMFHTGHISVTLGAKNGTFPSFLTILGWIAKKLDIDTLFGWLDEDIKSIFDVAVTKGSLTVDTESLFITDYSIGLQITLWGLKLDVTYLGADKLLRGSCDAVDKEKGISFLDKVKELTGAFPDALADIEITDVEASFYADTHDFSLTCTLSDVLTVGSFHLEEVKLTVSKNSTVSFRADGIVKLSDYWEIDASVTYKSGGIYIFWGKVSLKQAVGLPDIPFLSTYLADNLEIIWEPLSIQLKDGKLVKASAEITLDNIEKEKGALDNVLSVEADSGGDSLPIISSQKALPETGALRAGDGERWKDVSKKLGLVSIDRAGISFENSAIYGMLDGSITLGCVEFGLIGLKVGFDIAKRALTGDLNGISLSCDTKAFGLSGAIYKSTEAAENVRFSYSGGLSLKFAKWELRAVASYAELDTGEGSLFVFVNCQMMLTLLPAFTLTGIMGGLGVNRKLLIPEEASEVEQMPLLQMDGDKSSIEVLAALETGGYVTPSSGNYWAAVGAAFTICGLFQGKVLLALMEGEEFQAALIGTMDITLPKNAKKEDAYAYVELLLSAVLKPESGTFSARAAFSDDSFLLSRNCHIFGQAACDVWFGSSSHAGDFVFSIGGYHPSYQIPAYYPSVSRVGFSWQVCSNLSAKGSAYLAVTPACVMAGGRLQFNYQIGNLKAWFCACADMLLKWHPFAFDVQIGIEIGISYYLKLWFIHKTISLSLGANLHLWGTPVGGSVKIHLSFLSFTISFGKSADSTEKSLNWTKMRKTLIPDENLNTIRTKEHIRTQEDETKPWITEGSSFSVLCETSIPEGSISIAPMNLKGVTSDWNIRMTSPEGKSGAPDEMGFTAQAVEANLPAALFGTPQDKITLEEGSTVKGVSQYILKTPTLKGNGELVIYDYREALTKSLSLDNPLTKDGASEAMAQDRYFSTETVSKIKNISSDACREARQNISSYLSSYYTEESGEFTKVGQQCDTLYMECPMLAETESA